MVATQGRLERERDPADGGLHVHLALRLRQRPGHAQSRVGEPALRVEEPGLDEPVELGDLAGAESTYAQVTGGRPAQQLETLAAECGTGGCPCLGRRDTRQVLDVLAEGGEERVAARLAHAASIPGSDSPCSAYVNRGSQRRNRSVSALPVTVTTPCCVVNTHWLTQTVMPSAR